MKIKSILCTAVLFGLLIACSSPTTEQSESAKPEKKVESVEEWSKNATIYEVNIRQHTPEGTFNAFKKDLPRLKEIGVKILWFMPISPIGEINRKGGLGSYYSIADYTKVNPEFGTLEDFKALVKEAHQLGLKVILDWVANHTAWDSPWMENKEWYTLDSNGNPGPPEGTDWSDVVDLNYDNPQMKAEMINSMKWWVTACDIDGYRCDVASWVPIEFWEQARTALDSIKPVFMLAEAEDPALHKNAFHMSYAWEYMHIINHIAKGDMPLTNLDNYMLKEDTNHQSNDYRMYFITNHDENSWNGTIYERYGQAYKTYAALTFTIDGMPLIYSGMESSVDKSLRFFEKDTVEWGDYDNQEFYQKLIELNNTNPALYNGAFGGSFIRVKNSMNDMVYSFVRTAGDNKVFTVCNLKENNPITITFEGDKHFGTYTDLYSGKQYEFKDGTQLALEPYGFQIFYK